MEKVFKTAGKSVVLNGRKIWRIVRRSEGKASFPEEVSSPRLSWQPDTAVAFSQFISRLKIQSSSQYNSGHGISSIHSTAQFVWLLSEFSSTFRILVYFLNFGQKWTRNRVPRLPLFSNSRWRCLGEDKIFFSNSYQATIVKDKEKLSWRFAETVQL